MLRQFFVTLLTFLILSLHFPFKVFGNSFLQDIPPFDGVYVRTTDGAWLELKGTKIKLNPWVGDWVEYYVSKDNVDTIFWLDYEKFQGFLIKGISFVEKYKNSPTYLDVIRLEDGGVIVSKNKTREEAVETWRKTVGYQFIGYGFRAGLLSERKEFQKEFRCLLTESYLYCEPRDKESFFKNLYNFTHTFTKSEKSVGIVDRLLGTREIYVEDHGCFLIDVHVSGFERNIICLTGKPKD